MAEDVDVPKYVNIVDKADPAILFSFRTGNAGYQSLRLFQRDRMSRYIDLLSGISTESAEYAFSDVDQDGVAEFISADILHRDLSSGEPGCGMSLYALSVVFFEDAGRHIRPIRPGNNSTFSLVSVLYRPISRDPREIDKKTEKIFLGREVMDYYHEWEGIDCRFKVEGNQFDLMNESMTRSREIQATFGQLE
jgi:hypothetical protein